MVHSPVAKGTTISQEFGHLNHVGIDFNLEVGSPVYSVLNGKVIKAVEDSPVYGRNIMILHDDGYAALYAHLSQLKVKEGDTVKAGQVIGLSGGDPKDKIDGDGQSSGAHLHFEIRIPFHLDNNLYNINPSDYLIPKMIYSEYRKFQSCQE